MIERILGQIKAIDRSALDLEVRPLLEQINQVEAQLERATERIVRANQRLVMHIASQHMNRGLPLLDLIQEGNLGLMKPVLRFDPSKGCRFGTYAWWWIWQAMDKAAKTKGRLIRLPLGMHEARSRYRRAIASLSEQTRRPNASEIMEKAELSPQQLTALRSGEGAGITR